MTPLRPSLAIVLVVCLSATLHTQQAPPDPRPQATFKAGIDVVQLDVSVFDKDRRPIRGLTAEDFTILENGTPQPIVALSPIDLPDPSPPSAPWMRDAPLDVVSNSAETRRLVLLVLDDAGMGVEFGEPKSVREIAHRIVDQLGPNDLASVVFTYLGKPENWSADRSRLRTAIESFSPKALTREPAAARGIAPAGAPPLSAGRSMGGVGGPPLVCKLRRGGCVIDTLRSVAEVLLTAPPGRKMVMLISSDGGVRLSQNFDQVSDAQNAFRALQRANATVYAFDPRGLTTSASGVETDDLWSIAAATGGYLFTNTNAPEARVPAVFQWNASYYLIGFRRTDAANDGRFHRLQVKVNRPGAQVQTRAGYYAPPREDRSSSRTRKPATAVDAALTGVIPSNELPLTLSVAPFAVPGNREATLTLVAGLDQTRTADATTRRVSVLATLFDFEGRSQGFHRQTFELKPASDRLTFEVYSQIPQVKPGRYEIRLAVESEGRAGSVFAGVDVPDFSKEALALSGVLLEKTPLPPVTNPTELAGIVPVKPTVTRTFSRDDRVKAFLRVYQKEPKPVRLAARIVNDVNESVFTRNDDLSSGSADYSLEIPVESLPQGQYLLTIEAVAGERRLTRDVRFTVR